MPVDAEDDLYRELTLCQERIVQIEHEIELLSWLPTLYGWSLAERLSREYARLESLWRLLICSDRAGSGRGASDAPSDDR